VSAAAAEWDAETFAAQARALTPRCIARLTVLLDGDDPASAVEAVKLLLAYGLGAPRQLHVVRSEAADERLTALAVPMPRWRS
jgi:hypothetical protein